MKDMDIREYSGLHINSRRFENLHRVAPHVVAQRIVVRHLAKGTPACPAPLYGTEEFVAKIFRDVGTSIDDIERMGLQYSLTINPIPQEQAAGEFPAYAFIDDARENLMVRADIRRMIDSIQKASRGRLHSKILTPVIVGASVAAIMVIDKYSTHPDLMVLGVAIVGVGGLLIMATGTVHEETAAIENLKKVSAGPLLRQWTQVAEEYGEWNIGLQHRCYGQDIEELEEYSVIPERIEDIKNVTPERVANFIAKAAITSVPADLRGFIVEVRPEAPKLAGTCLRLHLYNAGRPGDDQGDKRKRREPARNSQWSWLPVPAATPA